MCKLAMFLVSYLLFLPMKLLLLIADARVERVNASMASTTVQPSGSCLGRTTFQYFHFSQSYCELGTEKVNVFFNAFDELLLFYNHTCIS